MTRKQLYKLGYLFFILLYAVIGTIGMIGEPIVQKGANNFIIRHYTIYLILLTVLAGGAASWFFPVIFSKAWSVQKKGGKLFIPVVFLLLAFVLSIGMFRFYNSRFGSRPVAAVHGKIEKKWSESARRSTTYYFNLKDDSTGISYSFMVKRSVYQQLSVPGFRFDGVLYKGSLGILYGYGE